MSALQLEGYASLFGIADLSGDVVRAGAFRASLAKLPGGAPMFVRHDARLIAGRWNEIKEDSRGLFVRGAVDPRQPGAAWRAGSSIAAWTGFPSAFARASRASVRTGAN